MNTENIGNTKNEVTQSAICSALQGWGPMTLATVQAADLTDGTVTLRIKGPFPSTILGGQWFLFPDPPIAELRPNLDFMTIPICPEAIEAANKVPTEQLQDAIQWTESYLKTLQVRLASS